MEIIVGTAGHIDHGKTALVRALTGTDADRLPEEKQRGITIDIGFAELELEGVHFGFVDVPGHERFVKNMLAGASGIDVVMLVIAADEGVMPQTREHFEICRLLGLERGLIVLTKSDLVDEETLDLARLDAAELVAGSFLENARVVAVSSIDGSGIDELKHELASVASLVPARNDMKATFLPIDRSFTVKGFGAVVTGTLVCGEIAEGDELDLLPVGRRVRVRGVQTHGRKVAIALPGQRTAVNLAGIDHSEIERGMLLAAAGVIRPSNIFDAEIEILAGAPKPLRSRQRVRVHIGTAEVLARVFVIGESGSVDPGERAFVQFRLESPIACLIGDRFIVRSYSPQITIGGGRVLRPNAAKHRRRDIETTATLLSAISAAGDDTAAIVCLLVEDSGAAGITGSNLRSITGWSERVFREAIESSERTGKITDLSGRLIAVKEFDLLRSKVLTAVTAFHQREPLASGISREAVREQVFRHLPSAIFAAAITSLESEGKIIAEKETIRSADHRTELSPREAKAADSLRQTYLDARFEPPRPSDALAKAVMDSGLIISDAQKIFQLLLKSGEILKINEDLYFAAPAIDDLKIAVRSWADKSPDRVIDVAKFKEMAGVSRKYAIPLLEYFDRERVTVRAGDKRMVLK